MNIPKKLRETFRGYINTFFSPITPVYNYKVINFALYQQAVNGVLQKAYYQEIHTLFTR